MNGLDIFRLPDMSENLPLTDAQRRVFEFVLDRVADQGYPPTAREICARFGFKSSRSALDHLEALERKGYIHRVPRMSRGIAVTPKLRAGQGLPLVGRVAAGAPILAEENIEDRVALDAYFGPEEKTFLLRVQGDSMVNAGIFDGDLVVVRRQERVENGEVAVCLIGDEATVKRFFDEGGRFRLQPENDTMDPIYVTRSDASFRIGGKVVGVIRKVR